ncbi:MAG: diacylglycerol kinase family lipid kinase [Flavobacteriales bacterium]|nr:diacylglycerol kinase family lipid kinase [Flavobacteriales bacterium]
MSVLSKKWLVILNPTSGNGKSKRKWPEIKRLLEEHQFNYHLVVTEYPKHSITLVHDYVDMGFRHIICVGGDGTLHNIINGIMSQNKIPTHTIHVGMIPIGTGNDWVKTHKISTNIHAAIKTILQGNVLCQDIGKITFTTQKSNPVYFNNLAGIGFDGYVVGKSNRFKNLGRFSYFLGALIGLLSYKNFSVDIFINSKVHYSGTTLMTIVGLCKYSGGGMILTKDANAFDGLFDVSIAKNLSKLEIIKNLRYLFNGKITNHEKILSLKTKAISLEIHGKDFTFVQADGELLGQGNVKIHLIEKAFSFYA